MTTMQLRNADAPRSVFSDWLRTNSQLDSREYSLSITDIDYCVHQYMMNGSRGEQNIMIVEEKCRMAAPSTGQLDTLHIIDTALKCIDGKIIKNPAGLSRRIHYHGLHVLMFENTSPVDGKIFWDRREITTERLIKYLRFEELENTR